MRKVWVLGDGQLGAMLRHAGEPIGIDVCPIGAKSHPNSLLDLHSSDVVTPEVELWDSTPDTDLLAAQQNFVNREVFPVIADRLTQKQTLDKLGVATAKWTAVSEDITEQEVHSQLGAKVLLKRRRGGYDGKGQYWLSSPESVIPEDFRETSIAEQGISFTDEVSVIGVRSKDGQLQFYPLSQNHHVDGILKVTIGNGKKFNHLQQQAEEMLGRVMEHFNYVGVMAMECFVVESEAGQKQLIVNELAPRVHNSGHWTQAGCSVNQFESHLRAILGLPLGDISYQGLTVMINLVGTNYDTQWLTVAGARLHWYQKEVRAGRKLGHINLVEPDNKSLQSLADLLPGYEQEFSWLATEIALNI